jgi:hypothetical protein
MRLRVLLAVSLISTAAFGAGEKAPSAERIKSAAAEYDAGRRAFTDGKFEDAATHFENAYHDAPNAQTLRNAIRARKQASQLARAATLAIIAQQSYSDDEPTQQIVKETLAEAGPRLFKLTVTCDTDCGVAADGRVVSIEDAKRFSLFLQPGPHSVVVSWSGDRSKSLDVKAREGQALEQSFVAPPMPVAQNNIGGGTTTLTEQPSSKPFGPLVFIGLASLTAISGGVLIWSGIDTINNPGADTVRQKCAGVGPTCKEYQDGLASQTRTNVLIGVTGGLGLISFITVFLTQWSHPSKEAREQPKVEATLGFGTVGLAGRF